LLHEKHSTEGMQMLQYDSNGLFILNPKWEQLDLLQDMLPLLIASYHLTKFKLYFERIWVVYVHNCYNGNG